MLSPLLIILLLNALDHMLDELGLGLLFSGSIRIDILLTYWVHIVLDGLLG